MDHGLGDEVVSEDAGEGARLRRKENEYNTLKPPETSGVREQHLLMAAPAEGDYPESSFDEIAVILEGRNGTRTGSPVDAAGQPSASPRYMDDAGNMVEELIVRNYDGSSVAIVGTSHNRERMQARQSQWQHLYRISGGSRAGDSRGNGLYGEAGVANYELQNPGYPGFSGQRTSVDGQNEVLEQLGKTEGREGSGEMGSPPRIRTKILSKSGFSEFFVKNTLKGKGIIYKGPARDVSGLEQKEHGNGMAAASILAGSNTSQSSDGKTATPSSWFAGSVPRAGSSDNVGTLRECVNSGPGPENSDLGVCLRDWLRSGRLKASKDERLCMFRRVVELVDHYHSQGVALPELRPSCFKLLKSNQVKYHGSVQRDVLESAPDRDTRDLQNHLIRRRQSDDGLSPTVGVFTKKQKFGQFGGSIRQWPNFTPKHGFTRLRASDEDVDGSGGQDSLVDADKHHPNRELGIWDRSNIPQLQNSGHQRLISPGNLLEEKWYRSPEELGEGTCTVSSNIYNLGILLFEVISFSCLVVLTLKEHMLQQCQTSVTEYFLQVFCRKILKRLGSASGYFILNLHHAPQLDSDVYQLMTLLPDREILQSELIVALDNVSPEELPSKIEKDDAESELLLHFLVTLKEHKQKEASRLVEDVRCLDTDLEEVERRSRLKNPLAHTAIDTAHLNRAERTVEPKEPATSKSFSQLPPNSNTSNTRFISNINQLESAYFSMRSKIPLLGNVSSTRQDREILIHRENWYLAQEETETHNTTDSLGAFFDGLCKYARYTKFKVRGLLRTGDFNNSANVICSLSFDRDLDYFAAAGVSKKIKIFEFNSLFNDSVDIHYPVIEMSNESKLSCISWNNYIKNYLASTGYDGAVKLWDASTGQGICKYNEHEKRAWSVDFSPVYPTKLASGSDDCSVKLWSINEACPLSYSIKVAKLIIFSLFLSQIINYQRRDSWSEVISPSHALLFIFLQKSSIGTIRNIANVCCVQFSSHSTHLLAFGSADYRTYCYDLRNVRTPWCILAGHEKAVSYVKFLDSETLVTASTDNSLKIWDLNKTSSGGTSTSACSLTLGGHTNEKNFVGLSVSNGYIACGSETNEVYAYYRSLPMPITSHKFGSIDPISGKETDDDNGQFVSSVCWRGNSDMVVAANSSGCIKLLQML
ncbi:hypothetical protein Tsubulata_005662 [Turnera subulata]|uniref:Protein SPA1-RELATED 2 n=1 Tax=Turnera subulata TaxID=218843 RepID=A0A9Q0J0Z6_9ROSI|nr:hypothetical protein Tsubulata_005662 [Turnera subulata]